MGHFEATFVPDIIIIRDTFTKIESNIRGLRILISWGLTKIYAIKIILVNVPSKILPRKMFPEIEETIFHSLSIEPGYLKAEHKCNIYSSQPADQVASAR